MKNIVCVILFVLAMPVLGFSQESGSGHKKQKHKKSHKTEKASVAVPPWAAAHKYDATSHVYFPDYYTYYDAGRGGHVFWDRSDWKFTPTVPPFLEKVDLSKSRIQIMKGLSLDLHPEQNFPYYVKQYPPDPNNNVDVAAPIPGNPAAH